MAPQHMTHAMLLTRAEVKLRGQLAQIQGEGDLRRLVQLSVPQVNTLERTLISATNWRSRLSLACEERALAIMRTQIARVASLYEDDPKGYLEGLKSLSFNQWFVLRGSLPRAYGFGQRTVQEAQGRVSRIP